MQIIGEAVDGLEAIQKAQQLKPDLILLDIGLPTLNGIETARRIRELSPKSKILFVSENRSGDIVEEALRTGAGGYVVKSDAAGELLPAVEAVLKGKRFVSASLAGNDLTDPKDEQTADHNRGGVVLPFPPRDVRIDRRHEAGFYSDDRFVLDDLTQFIEAAAANLQSAMQDVAAEFQKETRKEVKLIYGSSGNLFQRLQNGAPFDMFFSANLDYPKKLHAAGLTEPGSYYEYARGKVVVWVPKYSKLDLSSGLLALLNPSIKKIAVANPQYAPYGQAAVAAMRREGVYEKVKDKFVLGENISQTDSFVVSGSADVGIVALSLALSPNMKDKGRYVEIPAGDYPPIEQACVILGSSKNKETAKEFLSFIKTSGVTDTLRSFCFDVQSSQQ